MKKGIVIVVAVAVAFLFAPRIASLGGKEAWAVKPPTAEQEEKAKAAHEEHKREKGKEIKKSGCPYGKDKTTGKCYQPKEGEFYEDAQGNIHRKETTCYNLPWKPCSGSTKAPDKSKSKAKDK